MSKELTSPKVERISLEDWQRLPEYSQTYPTLTTPGRRWRRHHQWRDPQTFEVRERWWIGTYVDMGQDKVLVTWIKPIIRVKAVTT